MKDLLDFFYFETINDDDHSNEGSPPWGKVVDAGAHFSRQFSIKVRKRFCKFCFPLFLPSGCLFPREITPL